MKINFLEIQNFKRLRHSRIDFGLEKTVFVGANNSGKTTVMDACIKFLGRDRKLCFNDFTASYRTSIDDIGKKWIKSDHSELKDTGTLEPYLPTFDVWIDVEDSELQYVFHIIPTLDWKGGSLGVRYLYEPKNINDLFKDFRQLYTNARKTENGKSSLKLWPISLSDYLEKRVESQFEIKAYILDPTLINDTEVQKTPFEMATFEANPLDKLMFVRVIEAQRNFSDVGDSDQRERSGGLLSSQLRDYYKNHLNPDTEPSQDDIKIIKVMRSVQDSLDKELKEKFFPSLTELESLGYPGLTDPRIEIRTEVKIEDALDHSSSVQYILDEQKTFRLPERYNGLGIQNLISLVFKLIRFRDEWTQTIKNQSKEENIQPIQLIFVEEPEAHLHVQVQQIFMRKAYEVLRNNLFLKSHQGFTTQLIVSTHSSHVLREVDFNDLRYFKRVGPTKDCKVSTSDIINLSGIFGKENETSRFAARYLQNAHCDLFFADAAILVEGSSEEMLIPHFIKNKYPKLNSRYISILNINGRHAHRLMPLLNTLTLTTLIIADIDTCSAKDDHPASIPKRDKRLITTNTTITHLLKKKSYDELLAVSREKKVIRKSKPHPYAIRVAFQTPQHVTYTNTGVEEEALARTFEDSLVYANMDLFDHTYRTKNDLGVPSGLINDIVALRTENPTLEGFSEAVYTQLRKASSKKAEFTLDLIFDVDPSELNVPPYIAEGLQWLQEQLTPKVGRNEK
jgi:predicted ATP-dependent endonuclease of OLD family